MIEEPFLMEHKGQPVNLSMEIERLDYEDLISGLLDKTITCVDEALADAGLVAKDIDKIVLVGGSTRTPLVQRLLSDQLGQEPHAEVDPDLCVALGAAIQGGLILGQDIGRVLVDVTPHSLGVRCLSVNDLGWTDDNVFSVIVRRNTALPASRSEIYWTQRPGQTRTILEVFQGESDRASDNEFIGSLEFDGLTPIPDRCIDVLVAFDLNLDGSLKVTARERSTGMSRHVVLENAVTRVAADELATSKDMIWNRLLDAAAKQEQGSPAAALEPAPPADPRVSAAFQLVEKAQRLLSDATDEDAAEIKTLIEQLQEAARTPDDPQLESLSAKLEDVLFYLEDVA